ncbi:MAG: SDR family oxidoreductase [Coriobacteriia bacterium]|nr:SDR family oxidoreductase [Coriobacteriia bacterium]
MSDLYLVTGGAGFIGSHVVDELLSRGDRVRVIDNFATGRRENLAHIADDVELFEGDIRSYERVHNAARGVDYVVHLAALPSVPRSIQDPLTTHEVNTTGTLNVLLAARDTGARRVVIASSSSVYGANVALPKREDMVLLPISPYGVTKLAAERYCRAFSEVYGLETSALRYFNVFGPRQNPHSQYSAVIPKFIDLARKGERPVIFGDGSQTRDFTFVANVVNGTLAATTAEKASGHAMNVACGASTSLNELVHVIGEVLGTPVQCDFEPERIGDIKDSYADVSLARELLGYEPHVSLHEGVQRVVAALDDGGVQ